MQLLLKVIFNQKDQLFSDLMLKYKITGLVQFKVTIFYFDVFWLGDDLDFFGWMLFDNNIDNFVVLKYKSIVTSFIYYIFMNIAEQVQILKSQRVIHSAGILSLPQFSISHLKWTSDPSKNSLFSYPQEQNQKNDQNKNPPNTQSQNKKNIKLTFPIHYLLNKDEDAKKQYRTEADTYIRLMKKFVNILRINKEEISLEKNNQHQDPALLCQVDYKMKKQFRNKFLQNQGNQNELYKYNLYKQITSILLKIVELRKELYQKIHQFYIQKSEIFYKDQIESLKIIDDLLQYEQFILTNQQYQEELIFFIDKVNRYIQKTQQSRIEAAVIAYQPKLGHFSLIMNPIILAIYTNMVCQIKDQQKRRPQKRQIKQESEKIFTRCNTHSLYYQRIIFVNFDGEESPHNLDILRTLSRYVMYISFPKNFQNYKDSSDNDQKQQASSSINTNNYFYQTQYDDIKSSERIRNYLNSRKQTNSMQQQEQPKKYHDMLRQNLRKFQSLNEQFRNKLQIKGNNIQNNKNIFVFPIESAVLNKRFPDIKSNCAVVKHYESNFVYSMINSMIKHICSFNPSLIIVSYNGKIHIQNHHFQQMMKVFTVQTNSRIMFFPNMSKVFFEHGQMNDMDQYLKKIARYKMESYNTYQKQFMDISKNDDIFQKIQIFHTVASGKSNLQKCNFERLQLQKYKNIMIKPYTYHLMKAIQLQNQIISSMADDAKKELHLHKTLLKSLCYNEYQKFFPEESFVCKFISHLQELIFDEMNEQSIYKSDIDFLNTKYNREQLKEIIEKYKLQMYINKLSEKQIKLSYLKIQYKHFQIKNNYDFLQPVKFFTKVEGNTLQINITKNTQVLYKTRFQNKNQQRVSGVVYVLNHLFDKKQWKNYYGFVKYTSHQNLPENQLNIQDVELFQFHFPQEEFQNKFTVYSNWNYHETSKYSFLYWPIKFDFVRQGLRNLSKILYTNDETLSQKIFYAPLQSPGNFKQLILQQKTISLTKCNAISFQNQKYLTLFIFGGWSYSSRSYIQNQSTISKFEIDQDTFSVEYQRYIVDGIPPFSELQIQIMQDRIFLIGGFGKRYGTLFYPATGHFYEITQPKYIQSQIQILNPGAKCKKHDVIKTQEQFAYEPINILAPLKLRQSIYTIAVNHKFANKLVLSKKPQHCSASQGYLIRNYYQRVVKDALLNNNRLMRAYEEFDFVDCSYFTYSEQFQEFNKKITTVFNKKAVGIMNSKSFDNYINIKLGRAISYIQCDYVFVPSTELRSTRLNKQYCQSYEQVKNIQKDIIYKVENITKNSKQIIILFSHPRITLDKWVLASCNMGYLELDEKKKQIQFRELGRFEKDKNGQSKYLLNLLDNGNLFITKHKDKLAQIFLFQKQSNKNLKGGTLECGDLTQKIEKPFQFNLTSYTHGNVVIFIAYYPQNDKQMFMQFYALFTSPGAENYSFINFHQKKSPEKSGISMDSRLIVDDVENQRKIFSTSQENKVVFNFLLINKNNGEQQDPIELRMDIQNTHIDFDLYQPTEEKYL